MDKFQIHRIIGHRTLLIQLFRYTFVGIMSNIGGYLAYLFFTYFGSTPKATMSLLYVVGATIGFYGNRSLTFAYKGSIDRSGFRYFIAQLAGYFINLAILAVFVDKLGYTHQTVQAVAIVIVAAFLFTASKFFVFLNPNIASNSST